LIERWTAAQAGAYGDLQHVYAHREIEERRLSNLRGTIGMYINDSIKHKLTSEQVLYYSENCFGTADTIGFRYKTLRIFDLKTGVTKASVHQLEIYAAIFCLEYNVDPNAINIELRIYQDDQVSIFDVDSEEILFIMDKIVEFDKIISHHRSEEMS
jgi:hypothetical protein